MADEKRVRVTVSVADSHLGRFAEMTEKLRAAGMDVEQTLDKVGVVVGKAAQDKLPALGTIPGVESVEQERTVQLPPPGSKVQ